MKKILIVVSALLTLFVTLPVWLFLIYKILAHINATELMWFLYWVYLPLAVLMQAMVGLVKWLADE